MTLEQAQQYFANGRHSSATMPIDEVSIRALADALPHLVWSARPDGCVDYLNARWSERTGGRHGDGGDESWKSILHPEDAEPCLDAWHRAVETGEPFEMEYRLWDGRTGEYRWHLGQFLPSKTVTGRIKRWFGMWTDIHERKETLRALEAQVAELHGADRRKDEFLAMLAHEIRNPLASIASATALLRIDDAAERAWAADVIDRQTGQLTRLIDDLLDVTRVATGKIELRKEPLDLAVILDRAVETIRPVIRENQHELLAAYPRGSLFVEADSDRVEQMVVNLLANAAKYTPPCGHLALRAMGEDGEVKVVVQDDGIGIAPEKLPEIFNLFMQGERPAARSKDGLGLGLTIVKKLAELHGGTVSAASAGVDRGSQFTVRLPAAICPASPPPPPARALPPAAAHARILIVDDHADSANGLARLLRRRGHQVEVAYDGPAAFEAAAAFQPEVVLLDLDLPKMDGFEVAARIRRDPVHCDCLLIALTGYGQEEDRKRCREAGFDHHVLKPIDLALLDHFISDFLSADD